MTNNHANDEELQQYVLQKAECAIDVITHIGSCALCKAKAKHYSLLFEEINQQEKPIFDFNLADLVIDQLPKAKRKTSYERSFFYIIISIPFVFGSVVFFLFETNLLSLFRSVTPILVGLIITTVAWLLIFLCIDMYRKYQAKMEALNFY